MEPSACRTETKRIWVSLLAVGVVACAVCALAISSIAVPGIRADTAVEKLWEYGPSQQHEYYGPHEGISGSWHWSSCDYPHMGTCSDHCCCDSGYAYKSKASTVMESSAAGAASGILGGAAGAAGGAATSAVSSLVEYAGHEGTCNPISALPQVLQAKLQ